jgi:hypothetical protein
MIRLISHRGNLTGPNPERENHPDYIMEALKANFEVEIDLWKIEDRLFLGHDDPQYEVDDAWLQKHSMGQFWIHCKNGYAFQYMVNKPSHLHYFFHNTDLYTLTSRGYIWAYPNATPLEGCIIAVPEVHYGRDETGLMVQRGFIGGVCSDYVVDYAKMLNTYSEET